MQARAARYPKLPNGVGHVAYTRLQGQEVGGNSAAAPFGKQERGYIFAYFLRDFSHGGKRGNVVAFIGHDNTYNLARVNANNINTDAVVDKNRGIGVRRGG